MVVAITRRQWSGLVESLGLQAAVAGIEASLGVSFADDEGVRFEHRNLLLPLVEAAVSRRPAADLARRSTSAAFAGVGTARCPAASRKIRAWSVAIRCSRPLRIRVAPPTRRPAQWRRCHSKNVECLGEHPGWVNTPIKCSRSAWA
jgi:2-methylfumaryl-CoA isomerase